MHRFLLYRAPTLLTALILVLSSMGSLIAQDVSQRSRVHSRIADREAARHGAETPLEEEEEEELSQQLDFDYGGIFRFTYYDFDDGEDTHVLRVTNISAWGNLVYKDTHQLYARVDSEWRDYNKGTQYFYMEENDADIGRLDVGYYQTILNRWPGLANIGDLRLKAGRDYYTVGEGMVLDRRGDGAILDYTYEDFSLSTFVMRTIYSEDGSDRSYPGFGYDKRLFSGVEVSHEFLREIEAYGYAVIQRFKGRHQYSAVYGVDPRQKFGEDTEYYGGGFRGSVGPGLTYFTEIAKETGNKYSEGIRQKDRVNAWAYTAQVEYTLRTVPTQPRFSAQYLFGSGDKDAGNTLDTVGGNRAGTDYTAFTSYGYINTGLVFFPDISNITMYRIGATFTPVRDMRDCHRLEAGVNAFYYNRNKSSGGISDRFVGSSGGSHLGEEVDFFVNWRPFSDVTIIAQYGVFWPDHGPFTNDGKRHYFSTGFILYF